MKYAFYSGCVALGGCPELYPAAKLVCQKLGLELDELHLRGAACCGAGVLQEKNQFLGDVLNARTFAMAEQLGLSIMTICSTCQGVMAQANWRMQNDPEYLEKVNAQLAPEGYKYNGTVVIKHLLWIILEEVGVEKFKQYVVRPLKGLKVAPFYGCYILRPSNALGFKDNPDRQTSLETIISLVGAEPVDYAGKTKCCGFPILTINETNSVKMVANHTSNAKDLGADAMVTPCPLCHLNLDGYQPKASKQAQRSIDMPILHLPQMLGLAMGMEPRELGLQRHIISPKKMLEKVNLKA